MYLYDIFLLQALRCNCSHGALNQIVGGSCDRNTPAPCLTAGAGKICAINCMAKELKSGDAFLLDGFCHPKINNALVSDQVQYRHWFVFSIIHSSPQYLHIAEHCCWYKFNYLHGVKGFPWTHLLGEQRVNVLSASFSQVLVSQSKEFSWILLLIAQLFPSL